jgi:hypothetical protein
MHAEHLRAEYAALPSGLNVVSAASFRTVWGRARLVMSEILTAVGWVF